MSNMMTGDSWKLSTYGRFGSKSSKSSEIFNVHHTESQPLVMGLSKTLQLVVTKGTEVLESHSLVHSSMTVVQKNEAMIFLKQNQQGGTSWFRVKFMADQAISAAERREDCLSKLEKLIHVKRIRDTKQTNILSGQGPINADGSYTLAAVAKVMCGDVKADLPLAYGGVHLPEGQMDTMVRLCLCDTEFPTFVGRVERVLTGIKEES